jgi:hypothetical protein
MTGGKMVVLKPVVWNDNGYTWPAGITTTGGYSKQHGYGHEEWNGRSDWVWKGWKVFHTQGKGEMHRYASYGRLGIIMTTMIEKKFYAVGVGCNVFGNTDQDNTEIAHALGLPGYADRMWNEVVAIRDAKNGKRGDFDQHWRDHMHVAWRCPLTHYAWFDEPIMIEPNQLIPSKRGNAPRQAIVKVHSSYQAVRPDQALSIVRQALPNDHPVIGWLTTGVFDPVRNEAVKNAARPKGGGNSASTAIDPVIRYMQRYEIVVSPLHHRLQSDFMAYLKKTGIAGEANVACVDLRYSDPRRGTVLVEVKPTEPATVRYAIRTAMRRSKRVDRKISVRMRLMPLMATIIVDDGVDVFVHRRAQFEKQVEFAVHRRAQGHFQQPLDPLDDLALFPKVDRDQNDSTDVGRFRAGHDQRRIADDQPDRSSLCARAPSCGRARGLSRSKRWSGGRR